MVRALAFHQCGLGSIPGLDVICGLSLLLVLFSAPRGFSPGTPVFPSPQKPTFLNSNSIRYARAFNTWAPSSGDWATTPHAIELKYNWFDLNCYVIYSPRALPESGARGQRTRGINHITRSWRLIKGLFLHWRGFLQGCKNTLTKNASIVHLSFWHRWHLQVSRLFNYFSFQSRISNYLFAVNARNSLKSLTVSSDSKSEVEPFIT